MTDITFEARKKDGDIGEYRYLDVIAHYGYTLNRHAEGYFPDYDFDINAYGVRELIEIKTCKLRSPNVAVEISCNGQESGVYSTKADKFYIYSITDDKFYCSKTSELINFIKSYDLTIKKNLTNNSNTYIALIPKSAWEHEFEVIECRDISRDNIPPHLAVE